MPALAALLCGFVFGWGLLISGMMQPTKVLAFLDVFGDWDPSLAVVMAAALVVSWSGFALAKRRERPLLEVQGHWPVKTAIDRLSAQIEQLAVRAAAAETAVADSNSRRSEEFRRDVQEVRDLLKEFE